MTDAALFGLELRRARERRGLSLDQLAEVTKISGSLFGALERGDLSRWPGGIFRRAFVRSYANAVGLDPEETVARFVRLFPETEGGAVAAATAPATSAETAESGPRLVLDDGAVASGSTGGRRIARRVGAALLDLSLAGAPAAVVSLALGWQWFFPVAAIIGLVGHVVGMALVGASPGAWLLLPRAVVTGGTTEEPARLRVEAEPVAATPRRRQPRHASVSTPRPVPAARTRRAQH